MVQTLCQKILTIFCQKAQNFIYSLEHTIFFQNLPENGPNA